MAYILTPGKVASYKSSVESGMSLGPRVSGCLFATIDALAEALRKTEQIVAARCDISTWCAVDLACEPIGAWLEEA